MNHKIPEKHHSLWPSGRLGVRQQAGLFGLLVVAGVLVLYAVVPGTFRHHQDPSPVSQPQFTVDLNSASEGELIAIPGVGPEMAKAIIRCRTERGPFRSVQDLDEINNVGAKTILRLQPFLDPIGSPLPNGTLE